MQRTGINGGIRPGLTLVLADALAQKVAQLRATPFFADAVRIPSEREIVGGHSALRQNRLWAPSWPFHPLAVQRGFVF